MSIPASFLDELRRRITLSELVRPTVKLVRRGREFAGLCPFHQEKTPSFYVVDDKAFWHCFGCPAHGDAITWLERTERLDFLEAVERLAELAGMELPTQSPQERSAVRARGDALQRPRGRRGVVRAPDAARDGRLEIPDRAGL
jgi:DNA primase